MAHKTFRIGVVQPHPVSTSYEDFRNGGDVDHACELLSRFEGQADLVCFPEMYPWTGEKELGQSARALGIGLVAGIVEQTPTGCYNTATLFGRDGSIIGRQRKKYPTAGEIERAGISAGKSYEVFDVEQVRIGMVICADLPFFTDWRALIDQKADVIFNLSRWFALSDAYPATIISRHLEFGRPFIGLNWARFAFPQWDQVPHGFPPAGGHTTITIPPSVTNLKELGHWFRTKQGGIDSMKDFATVLGEEEETATVTIDIDAVRRFPGYFYYEPQRIQ